MGIVTQHIGDRFNILRIKDSAAELKQIAANMMRNTLSGENSEHAFGKLPTYIPALACDPIIGEGPAVIMDIGGTHTRIHVEENKKLREIDDIYYDRAPGSNMRTAASPMKSFANLCMEALKDADITTTRGMAIIWSNAGNAIRLDKDDDGISGVGMEITKRESAYNKGEPFIEGLTDGDRLDWFFSWAAEDYGLSVPVILFTNDVPVSIPPDGDAGMVASTGANGTLFIDGEIYNGELGALFKVPCEMLSNVERSLHPEGLCLEELMAGKGLAARFREHVIELAKTKIASETIAALGLWLENNPEDGFATEDLSTLIVSASNTCQTEEQERQILEFREKCGHLSEADAHSLRWIASALVSRAAFLAGFMAWICISNQIEDVQDEFASLKAPNSDLRQTETPKSELLVGLESSLARHVPGYFEQMQAAFETFIDGQCPARIVLLAPDESGATASQLGAARALDRVIKSLR